MRQPTKNLLNLSPREYKIISCLLLCSFFSLFDIIYLIREIHKVSYGCHILLDDTGVRQWKKNVFVQQSKKYQYNANMVFIHEISFAMVMIVTLLFIIFFLCHQQISSVSLQLTVPGWMTQAFIPEKWSITSPA